jgi:hypothetical protein
LRWDDKGSRRKVVAYLNLRDGLVARKKMQVAQVDVSCLKWRTVEEGEDRSVSLLEVTRSERRRQVVLFWSSLLFRQGPTA